MEREIQRLQYLVKYLTLGQQKRDEIIAHIQVENKDLRENIFELNSKQKPLVNANINASTINTISNNNSVHERLQQAKSPRSAYT